MDSPASSCARAMRRWHRAAATSRCSAPTLRLRLAPRGKTPYVFDFATSVAARGEIELHRQAGKPLPEGWAIDAEGAADHRSGRSARRRHAALRRAQGLGHRHDDRAPGRHHDRRPDQPGSPGALGATNLAPAARRAPHRLLAGSFLGADRRGDPFARAEVAVRGDRRPGRPPALAAPVMPPARNPRPKASS